MNLITVLSFRIAGRAASSVVGWAERSEARHALTATIWFDAMLGFATLSPAYETTLSPAYELDADGRVADVMAQGVWHVCDGETLRMGMFETPQADRA